MSISFVLDYFHELVSARLFVVLCILCWLPLGDWTAYILVPGGITVLCMFLAKLVKDMIQNGFFRAAWEWAKFWLGTGWIKAALQMRHLNESWWGQAAVTFGGIANPLLISYWAYYNVNLVKFIRSTTTVIWQFYVHVTHPPMVMKAFHEWIGTFWGLATFLEVGKRYTAHAMEASEKGEWGVLWALLSVSVGLGLVALAFYYGRSLFVNYSAAAVAGVRGMLPGGGFPPAPPPAGGGSGDDNSSASDEGKTGNGKGRSPGRAKSAIRPSQ